MKIIHTTKPVSKINVTSPKILPQSNTQLLQQFIDEGLHKTENVEITLGTHSPYEFGSIDRYSTFWIMPMTLESLAKDFQSNISEEDIKKIFAQIITILQNPESVAKHLKSLDAAIGEKIAPLEYNDNDLPQYLIPARGYFIPGPPPENYRPRNQGRALDIELLRREQAEGINLEGTPKFVGLINRKKADQFVADGHLFSEDLYVQSLILHSKYAHRLQHEVIRSAIAAGEIELLVGTGEQRKQLNQKEFLKLLVTKTINQISLWDCLTDTLIDSLAPVRAHEKSAYDMHERGYSPDNFSYSSRSPFTINSLITCFGKELDLPNLQHYLLNSHWKAAAPMVETAREIIKKDNGAVHNASKLNLTETLLHALIVPWQKLASQAFNESGNEIRKFRNRLLKVRAANYEEAPPEVIATDFSNLYTNCMKSLATIGFINPGQVSSSPLTTTPQQAATSKKYQSYAQDVVLVNQNPLLKILRDHLPTEISEVLLPPGTTTVNKIDKGIKRKNTEPKPIGITEDSMDSYAAKKLKTSREIIPQPEPSKFNISRLFKRHATISPTSPNASSH